MRKIALFSLLCMALIFTSVGCKKLVQKIQENAITALITENLWVVHSFSEGGTDLTASFTGYEFQFNKDFTLYGLKTGSPTMSGTWSPNVDSLTIATNFPSATGDFKKLNGLFKITNSTTSYVKANRFEGATEFKLWLDKK